MFIDDTLILFSLSRLMSIVAVSANFLIPRTEEKFRNPIKCRGCQSIVILVFKEPITALHVIQHYPIYYKVLSNVRQTGSKSRYATNYNGYISHIWRS